MDLLTHVFLPLTVVYVLRQELFDHPAALAIGGFGLLSDFDKFLGQPGLLHSLVTLVPVCLAILAVERWYRGGWQYAPVVSAVILSHLLLDFIDGGPVPALYPFIERGVGLQFPAQTVFGTEPVGMSIRGPLVKTTTHVPREGFNSYGFLAGDGIAWALVFAVVFVGLRRRRARSGTIATMDGGFEPSDPDPPGDEEPSNADVDASDDEDEDD